MWCFGIDENGQPAVEFVRLGRASRTPWIVCGGVAKTEERAKILLRQLIKKRENNDIQAHKNRG